jgi:protein involved in polysaccharide export with SLBB domain
VTAANGYHMDNGDKLEITIPADQALYGITSTGTNVISVLYNI